MWQSMESSLIKFLIYLSRNHAEYLEKGMVKFMVADGREGLPQEGPFDIIIVGGGIFDVFRIVSFSNQAVKELPEHFLDQIAPGGSMVHFQKIQ